VLDMSDSFRCAGHREFIAYEGIDRNKTLQCSRSKGAFGRHGDVTEDIATLE